jgi:hypothetical protein
MHNAAPSTGKTGLVLPASSPDDKDRGSQHRRHRV